MNYYNEFDPKAAAWLRELIKAGLIAPGDVDERSIADVKPAYLTGYAQCHFFAGIGGWSYALRLAGWPDDRPVWTGSCPCQPFSSAGKQLGNADARHLWPVFFNLIRQCRPERVFGEQVASAIGHGWLDGVSADLEAEGYACGAVVLGAHSVGAPHIRQRLYWVADAEHAGHSRAAGPATVSCSDGESRGLSVGSAGGLVNPRRADAERRRGPEDAHGTAGAPEGDARERERSGYALGCAGSTDWLADAMCGRRELARSADIRREEGLPDTGGLARMGNADEGGLRERGKRNGNTLQDSADWNPRRTDDHRPDTWASISIPCRDGKSRRGPAKKGVEPILQRVVDGFPGSLDNRRAILDALLGFPLSEGIRGRVPLLKGYGNAIVPQVAAEFIRASEGA